MTLADQVLESEVHIRLVNRYLVTKCLSKLEYLGSFYIDTYIEGFRPGQVSGSEFFRV